LSKPVYGTLSVTYLATVIEITVKIKPREAAENNYSSSILVTGECVSNGITEFEISIPICFQSYYDDNLGGIYNPDPGCSLVNPGKIPDSKGFNCSYKWEYCWPHRYISGTGDTYDSDDCYGGFCNG
jgi:hypothetical protein